MPKTLRRRARPGRAEGVGFFRADTKVRLASENLPPGAKPVSPLARPLPSIRGRNTDGAALPLLRGADASCVRARSQNALSIEDTVTIRRPNFKSGENPL